MDNSKIIVAIDTPEEERLSALLNDLNPDLCMIKIGSILFNSLGRRSFDLVADKGFNIFFDIKFHDIPHTVAHSILSFRDYPINLLTVHISGGMSMLIKAREAAHAIKSKIIGVSLLTSLDQKDIKRVFFNNTRKVADNLFDLAKEAKMDGIVCSAHELKYAMTNIPNLLKIVPGIRLSSSNDDQKRVMSPAEALDLGANHLVIGRPITESRHPNAELEKILETL